MEGMERFSYYGFRAILTLYFVSLNLRESSAAAGFMFTSALAYAAPLVGAWLSDELWGRYATIMRFGSVYASACGSSWLRPPSRRCPGRSWRWCSSA